MVGTFTTRAAELTRQIGGGPLTMRVEVDQVYAKYQELRDDLKHKIGQAHALRDGLLTHVESYLETLAQGVLTEEGTDIHGAAIRVVERLDKEREALTPIEFANLLRSGHQVVTDDGETIYDRPPDVHRLSAAELRAQRHHGEKIDYGKHTRPRLGPFK